MPWIGYDLSMTKADDEQIKWEIAGIPDERGGIGRVLPLGELQVHPKVEIGQRISDLLSSDRTSVVRGTYE